MHKKQAIAAKLTGSKPSATSHFDEVEARLFKGTDDSSNVRRFSSVRREHTALHWQIEARENAIYRAAGYFE